MSEAPDILNPQSGLTAEEQQVADLLVTTWNTFMALECAITIDERQRFRDAIHQAQQVFADRALQRAYPEYWN